MAGDRLNEKFQNAVCGVLTSPETCYEQWLCSPSSHYQPN